MAASSASVNLGASAPGVGQVGVGVPALQHDRQERGIELAGGRLGGPDVLGGVDDRDRGRHVLGEADLRVAPPGSADRLHRQAVAQHGVVPDLIQPGRRELQLGRRPQGASRQ